MPNYWYHHLHIVSPEPAKTVQFYEKMFGAKVISTAELPSGRTSTTLDLDGWRFSIITPQTPPAPAPSEPGYGMDHLGLRTDNLEEAVTHLKANGVQFTREITEIRPGVKVAFMLGPENVIIELLETGD